MRAFNVTGEKEVDFRASAKTASLVRKGQKASSLLRMIPIHPYR